MNLFPHEGMSHEPGFDRRQQELLALVPEAWLFGRFGIVDAMYASVALRIHTYQLDAGPSAQEYVGMVLGHPALAEWITAGKEETEIIQAFEE